MKPIILILIFILSACTTMQDLKPIENKKFFEIKENHTMQFKNIFGDIFIYGLRAGKYISMREDEKGVYFFGEPDDSVISLNGARAEQFIKTGYITPWKERCRVQSAPLCGGYGGLWLPKSKGNDREKLFFFLKPKAAADADPGTGWLTKTIIDALVEDSLTYIYFDTEKDFLSSLKIEDLPPTHVIIK